METTTTTPEQKHSAAELKKMLAEAEAAEKAEREKARLEYEQSKESTINALISAATSVNQIVSDFKKDVHLEFEKHAELLEQYGGIRSNSKGGFSLISKDGSLKVTRHRSTTPQWDERSEKALELISDFLRDTVKKRDVKIYDILQSFLQKNKKGDLEYSKVMQLLTHKDKYEDPRWIEGLDLLQESFSIQLRCYSYSFHQKDDQGSWEPIDINFHTV